MRYWFERGWIRWTAMLVVCLLTKVADAASGTWNVDASGNWSDTGNWAGGPPGIVADGDTSTANFTNNITGDTTVTLDTDRTIGQLIFGDGDTSSAGDWIIDGDGTTTLTIDGPGEIINVNALGAGKVATIKVPVTFISNGISTINSVQGSTLELSGSNAVWSLPATDSVSGGSFHMRRGTFSVTDGATFDLRYKGTTPGVIGPALFVAGISGGQSGTHTGTFLLSGDWSKVLLDSSLTIGRTAGTSTGIFTMTGGTLTVSSTVGSNGFLLVGRDRPGTFNQSGGTVTVERNNPDPGPNVGTLFIGDQGGAGIYNLTGGTLNIVDWTNNTLATTFVGRSAGSGGSGTMTINGATAVANLSHLIVGGPAGTGTLDLQNGVLRSQDITKGATATATFRLGSASGTPVLAPYNTNATFGSATVANNVAITLNGSGATISSSDKDSTGRIVDVYSNIGETGGVRALAFDGAGTTNLRGTNTYTGLTTINGGTVNVNGSHTGGGNYTVNADATLGGTGTISGTVTLQTDATIAPGNTPGTLTVGGLALSNGSFASFELDNTAGDHDPGEGPSDFLDIVGLLNLSGVTTSFTLNVEAVGGGDLTAVGSWVLASYDSLSAGSFDPDANVVLNGIGAGIVAELSITGGPAGDLLLTTTAIPEASAFLVVGMVATGAGIISSVRRRRRSTRPAPVL
ncbi:MAG: hypothetical protein WD468_05285 [Pirellulales bacterium]